MDRDSLRKQLYDEIHAQFEGRLREARRQKSELEEEIELAEEKWRSERRRLNAEVDRLELAVADAREARRKAPVTKTRESDPEEVAKLQAAAEEKIRKAEQVWAAERETLRAEVSRLQNGIAEMIERSNNPLRSNQAEKDKLESRLQEALRARRQAEDALLKAKEEWDDEKAKLVGDMVKNRRSGTPTKDSKPKQDDGRIEQLERQLDEAIQSRDKQLKEAVSAREKLERELEKVRQSLATLKEGGSDSVARLKSDLEDARAEAILATRRVDDEKGAAQKARTDLEKQLRQETSARNGLERELEKVRQELNKRGGDEGAVSSDSTARLKSDLEDARAEAILAARRLDDEKDAAQKARTNLEQQLRQEISARSGLERELERVRQELINRGDDDGAVSSEVVEQLRQQYDERMQDMIRQKTQLSEELRGATSLLEEERNKIGVNGTSGHKAPHIDSGAIDAEVERIQDMIAGIAKIIEDPETELSTVIRKNVERAELDAYLRGILFSLGRGEGM